MKLKKVLLPGLLVLLIVPLGVLGLIGSESGSRWLLRQACSSLPGAASIKTIDGRLLDRMVLSDVHYQGDTETIEIGQLVFRWKAGKLFLGTLDIAEFRAQGLHIRLIKSQTPEDATPFELPDELSLPVGLIIEHVLLTDFKLLNGGQIYHFDKLLVSARTDHDQFHLTSLQLDAKPLAVTAHGKMVLSHGFPLRLDVGWRHLQWPMTGAEPQWLSEHGSIELAGLLNDYRMTLTGNLVHFELPMVDVLFNGKGSLKAMTVDKLMLSSEAGSLQMTGEVSWSKAPFFDLTASAQNFNPGIVLPEIPGSLTFETRLQGRFADEALDLDANLKQLSGRLRGYPVEASGKLKLSREQIRMDAFRVASGANRLSAEGVLAPRKSHFEFDIDAPSLNQIWPGLSGRLNGQGLIRGAWKNPSVNFQAKGKRLRYDGHQSEHLAVNIDYDPEANKISTVSLSADTIKSGAIQVSKVFLEGKGTPARHLFKTDIRSNFGDLMASLNGRLTDDSWQGGADTLNFKSRDFGSWQLEKKLEIAIAQKTSGFDAVVKESCLIRQQASLCVEGQYLANDDFRARLKTAHLPASLIQSRLPKIIGVQGLINGDADIRRQKNALSGQYQLSMPEGLRMHLQTNQGSKDIALGASYVSGKMAGELISSELNVALQNQDYVRGHLDMNTGKSQTIAGQLSASMVEFDWLEAIVPGVTDVQGDLKANLILAGTAGKPRARGAVKFSDGAVRVSGYLLDQIRLQAASVDNDDRIRLQGSARSGEASVQLDGFYGYNGDYQLAVNAPAVPLTLLQPYLPEQTAVNGLLNAEAEISQRKGLLTGHYRVDMPAGTKFIIKSPEPAKTLSLGASRLSGRLNGALLSADYDLGLVGKDFIRGQLQLDTGKSQALDGQMTATILELAPLNSFAPGLSGIRGRINADITVHGTVAKPIAQGSVELAQAGVEVADLGLSLREINLKTFTLADQVQRLQIQGSAKSGKGAINLDGFALLEPGWPLEVRLTGNNFEAVKLPEAEIAVSPDLKMEASRAQGSVTGQLKIDHANIELKQLPENSVQVSSDEIILGAENAQNESPTPFHVNAKIEVDLGSNIRFSGLGLKTRLAGKLRINKAGEKMTLHGNVDMKEARYHSYGQDLTVRKGRFVFNGPADNPWLDVEAIRRSKNAKITAILGLSGPAKAPKTKISSEPALPESEALAYLITGHSLNQSSKAEGQMIAGAALSFGLGKASWLADKLGLDEYEVKEGEKLQDTMVTVGRYLNPDFYVGSKVGLFNQQASLILKHKLTDALNVESETGESQRVKLNYEFDSD